MIDAAETTTAGFQRWHADFERRCAESVTPREIVAIGRPPGMPMLHSEVLFGYWYPETNTRVWFWGVNSRVHNALGHYSGPERSPARQAEICLALNVLYYAVQTETLKVERRP